MYGDTIVPVYFAFDFRPGKNRMLDLTEGTHIDGFYSDEDARRTPP